MTESFDELPRRLPPDYDRLEFAADLLRHAMTGTEIALLDTCSVRTSAASCVLAAFSIRTRNAVSNWSRIARHVTC
jgi:hypothetical protein